MRGGPMGWQVRGDAPQHLAIGLYVRAAAGLTSSGGWPPDASPAAAQTTTAPAVAGEQWDAWWARAVREVAQAPSTRAAGVPASWLSPPFEGLADAPEFRALTETLFGAAVRWSEERKREHVSAMTAPGRGLTLTQLVADMEHALDQQSQPFELTVTEIPAAGTDLWRVEPEHVVVTSALMRDVAAYRRRITPVIRSLF